MSYLKSSFNVCAFQLPKEFQLSPSEVHDRLLTNKFVDLAPSQETGMGWVAPDELFKVDFSLEDIVAGTGLVGGFRIDTKVVPKPLIKKLYREKLKDHQQEFGTKLNKTDKQILKEECKQQLLLKALPNPKMVNWIWDTEKNRVYLDTKSTKVIDAFMGMFTATFETSLEAITFDIIPDEITNFLDWLWQNIEKLETTWLDKDISLESETDTFKFNGPEIGKHIEEIESFKKTKNIKTISVGTALNKNDFGITFNAKNMIIGVANKNKIKHESIETAVLDNCDNITVILDTISNWVKLYQQKE